MTTIEVPRPATLVGRDSEIARLKDVLRALPDAGSALVLLGDAGIGKSCLLEELANLARQAGARVLDVAGIEPEAQLPFAGLLQLLGPVLNHVDALPQSQRRALLAAFEIEAGPAPQPFLVALAALGLLTEAAAVAPIVVVVDDAQWLDGPTHDALAFVARRLERTPIALVATVRAGHEGPLTRSDVPVQLLGALDDAASRQVLSRHAADLNRADRIRILAEAEGNPLALVELPAAWRARAIDDGFVPLNTRLERAFAARLHELPAATRDVLLVAAADDEDAVAEILAGAGLLAGRPVGVEALEPASAVGLLSYDARRISFRHPLVRSGILQAETMMRRQQAHAALGDALDGHAYRRSWHRAQAIVGVDDEVADALEESHTIALRRGSVTSAIRALERSAQLTSDSARRGRRLLLAAEHAFGLGRADIVDRLVTAAEKDDLSDLDRARTEWLREIFNDGIPGDAARIRELCAIAQQSASAGDRDLTLNLLLGAALRTWWADAGADVRAHIVEVTERIAAQQAGYDKDPRFVTTLGVAEAVLAAGRVTELLSPIAAEAVTDPDALRLYGMVAHAIGDPVRTCDFLGRAETRLREQGRLGLL
ncbi:MAG: AAA family ATPase, partial [Thermoleophilia bacterium]|nr:AAA family ATPase [Thermoleophilia bacterium]